MSAINNLVHVKITSVDSSSSINLGNAIQVNPTNNSVEIGSAEGVGDHSISATDQKNLYIDPDFLDQISKG